MQTTVGRKQKRFDHQQTRLLALIIGLVATVAIIAVALAMTRTEDDAEQVSAVIVTTQPPFSDTLDKGMLSPAVAQRERTEILRREGIQIGAGEDMLDLPEHGKGIIPGFRSNDVHVEAQEPYHPGLDEGFVP